MNIYSKYREIIRQIVNEQFNLEDKTIIQNINAEPPKDSSHGDIATNAAMVLAKPLKANPRNIAEKIVERLSLNITVIRAEIAGPGFINISLGDNQWHEVIKHVLSQKEAYGSQKLGEGKKINIEFVSANPTGPMHIGHARHAVLGDALSNLLDKVGYNVTREYYINDAGSQIDTLAKSAYLRYLEASGQKIAGIPEGLYPGEYLIEVGEKIYQKFGNKYLNEEEQNFPPEIRQFIIDEMMNLIRKDLDDVGVKHDVFTSEKKLHEKKLIEKSIDYLKDENLVYRGVLEPPKGKKPEDWEPREQLLFKSSQFGDDTDRPLQKSDNTYTYFASDIAYHKDKVDRNYDELILVLGADHGGYVKRISSAVKALSKNRTKITVLLSQLVKLMENGEAVKMSKRAGNFITMKEVLGKVGKDILRFIMLTRKSDVTLDFDLKKVLETTKENPVFYVQYAHARCCSAKRQAIEAKLDISKIYTADLSALNDPLEMDLIKKISEYPRVLETSAIHLEPHRITFYLYELANSFHQMWNLGRDKNIKIIDESNPEASYARLALVEATRTTISSSLSILGVEPVERM
jgi:arginyl-tRNA synthetase